MPGSSTARCTSARIPSLLALSASLLGSGLAMETGVNLLGSGGPLLFLDWFLTPCLGPGACGGVDISRLPGHRLWMEVPVCGHRQSHPVPLGTLSGHREDDRRINWGSLTDALTGGHYGAVCV